MGLASLALTAIGGGITAYSQYQSGKAQEQAAKYNAELMRQQAENEALEARENARRARSNNERQLASMRARIAGQGTGTTEGAPIAVLGETAGELELSVLDQSRASNGRRNGLMSQANNTEWEGKQARRASRINAFGTLLSTGTRTYDRYRTGVDAGAYRPSFLYRGMNYKRS